MPRSAIVNGNIRPTIIDDTAAFEAELTRLFGEPDRAQPDFVAVQAALQESIASGTKIFSGTTAEQWDDVAYLASIETPRDGMNRALIFGGLTGVVALATLGVLNQRRRAR